MTAYLYTALAFASPWMVRFAAMKIFNSKRLPVSALVSVVLVYACLLASVHAVDTDLQARLDSFDLDGDGVFSGAEITPAQQQAMEDWANDTGRAMAPITAAVISPIYVAAVLGIWSVAAWAVSVLRRKRL